MSQATDDPWDETKPKRLDRIGGWLWLVLLHLAAVTFLVAAKMLGLATPFRNPDNLHELAGHPVFLALAGLVALIMLAQVLLGLFCLVQFLRRRAGVPRWMTIWYALGIAAGVAAAVQFALYPAVFTAVVDQTATAGAIGGRATFAIVLSGILIVYFRVSKRVKAAFVR
jgi:hypothetical protein